MPAGGAVTGKVSACSVDAASTLDFSLGSSLAAPCVTKLSLLTVRVRGFGVSSDTWLGGELFMAYAHKKKTNVLHVKSNIWWYAILSKGTYQQTGQVTCRDSEYLENIEIIAKNYYASIAANRDDSYSLIGKVSNMSGPYMEAPCASWLCAWITHEISQTTFKDWSTLLVFLDSYPFR